jgi:hypothetical protein
MITIQLQDDDGLDQVADKLDDSIHNDFSVNRNDLTITIFELDRETDLDAEVREEIDYQDGLVI